MEPTKTHKKEVEDTNTNNQLDIKKANVNEKEEETNEQINETSDDSVVEEEIVDVEEIIKKKEFDFAQKISSLNQSLALLDFEELKKMLSDLNDRPDDEEKALKLVIIGGEFIERNHFPDAEALFKKAFVVYKNVTEIENIPILLNLACTYQQQGNFVLAEKFLLKSLDISSKRKVDESLVINSHIGLVSNYQLSGDLDKATNYCCFLVDTFGGENIENHCPELLYLVLTMEASVFLQQNEHNKAQQKLLQAIKLHRESELDISEPLNQTYLLLIKAYRTANKFDKAEEIANQGLKIFQEKFGPESWEVALLLISIADVKNAAEVWDEALLYYKRALPIYRRLCGNIHPYIAGLYYQLGDVLTQMGKFESGIKAMKKSVAIAKKWAKRNEVDCSRILSENYYALYLLYCLLNQFSGARKCLEKSIVYLESLGDEATIDEQLKLYLSALKSELVVFEKEAEVIQASGRLSDGSCPRKIFSSSFQKIFTTDNFCFV